MLPPEILDQVTALNSQNRELVGIINQLTRVNRGQLELDELSSTIKSGFAEADRAIENLEVSIDAEDDFTIKHEGEIYVAKISEDLKLARSLFRKNLLQASRSLNQSRQTQAAETLFRPKSPDQPPQSANDPSNSSTTLRQRRPVSSSQNDASLLTAATDVTLALKRTHALLEQELEKSNISLETLEHSSQTLRQLEHRYSAFDVLLRGSKRLILELERADKWDRYMIYGGLAIFGLTCLWIVYKRILRGPLGLIIWGVSKMVGSGHAMSVSKGPIGKTTTRISAQNMPVVNTPVMEEIAFEKRMESLWSEGVDPDETVLEEVILTESVE